MQFFHYNIISLMADVHIVRINFIMLGNLRLQLEGLVVAVGSREEALL